MYRVARRIRREVSWVLRVLRESVGFTSPARYIATALLTRLKLHEGVVFDYHGARFRLWNSPVSQYMYFHNSPRWLVTADVLFLKRLLRPGDVVIDIGANVGPICISLAKYLGDSSRIYAFEPHPRIFDYLQGNLQLNSLRNVEAYNCALGDIEGETHFTDLCNDDANYVVRDETSGENVIRVALRRLDSFEFAHRPVTLIKIDTEGYELFVLRGAEKALNNTQFLYLEAYEPNYRRFGYSLGDMVEFLSIRGWHLYQVAGTDLLLRIDPESPPSGEQLQNWVATKSEELLVQRIGASIQEPRCASIP